MFDNYFDVYLADTPKGKEEHFKLRYKVYCEEMGFEDKNDFSAHREHDHWDPHSVHFLVRHRETGQWIGAMRMVFKHEESLPLHEFCAIEHDMDAVSQDIEISRLCLVKDIRRRKTDTESPLALNTQSDPSTKENNVTDLFSRRVINRSLIWGLFRAASIYSAENNIDNWFFLGTKALARIISREGFKMTQVGEGCDHRGMRYPFRVELKEILANSIWTKDFKKGYRLFSELQEGNAFQFDKVA